MAGTKEIKRRIKSVKNTKKITKAMELVAASKMKRAISSTLASRLYAEYSWEMLTSIAENVSDITHPFFTERSIDQVNGERILLLLITSNKGLCGSYNAQAIKKAISVLKSETSSQIDVVAIGKRGDAAMRRVGKNIIATFTELPNHVSLADVNPISKLVLSEYSAENYDKVFVVYTDFISALTQKAKVKQILPVSKVELKELIESAPEFETKKTERIDYLIEGDINQLAGFLAEKITQMQIYQMILESRTSEESSRMVAMKNASEASGEMIDDLTLIFNKARQSNITREISEISAGMAAAS